MLVKVCGMRDPGNIQELDALKVDFMGLIFHRKSPRYVDLQDRIGILASRTKRIGVYVDADLDELLHFAHTFSLDGIQFHGSESPAYIKQVLDGLPGMLVFKAFSVKDKLPDTAAYESVCDYFLFDTAGAGAGGTGVQFDWSILQAYQGHTPFFLSGGIGPDSVTALKAFAHPKWIGIDLNSKFEHKPAMKNMPVLTEFLEKIRTHDTA
ncbi:MAG: phosphoribosylanthranilate isomerase [Saprospiraceae bacterium]|nr:phosphoribosylanthranilate isomerase [Saprospiraceae bacterium]